MGTSAEQRQHSNTAKPKKQSKAAKLLTHPDVKRWYDNVARSSPTTADPSLRKLGRFCELHQLSPMGLIELGMKEPRDLTNLLQDHISAMEGEEMAPQYIKSVMTAVKSWMAHFDLRPTRKLRIADVDSTTTLEDERVPNEAEMEEVFNRAPVREATSISLMSKSGLRPEVLGYFDGRDGLTMKDLPDIAIVQGEARCLVGPPRVIVRKNLSKAKHQYFTFLSSNGTKKLLSYLNERLAHRESLNAYSPVISPDMTYAYGRGRNSTRTFLPASRVSDAIRDTLRPRFDWRPYVFRAYFDTQLLIAESRGLIAHDFGVFFMGHKGSIEAKYTTNKGVLPEELINEMREAYRRSEQLLDLEGHVEDPIRKQREHLQTAIAGASSEQLRQVLEILNSMGIGKIVQAKK